MIEIDIPGRKKVKIEHVVFDYNGTLAVDGNMRQTIKEMLLQIKKQINVYILTADTFGTVQTVCKDLGVEIKTFSCENAAKYKKEIVNQLGKHQTICIGNGFNDIEMCKESTLSIAVIEKEGCCGQLLAVADIVVTAIDDVFGLLQNPNRIKATLRG